MEKDCLVLEGGSNSGVYLVLGIYFMLMLPVPRYLLTVNDPWPVRGRPAGTPVFPYFWLVVAKIGSLPTYLVVT